MSSGSRIAFNTIIQYCRTLINIILGFYSTRIILLALGDTDYGIYMLIAGVVGMLSFFTNALAITTQRFLSYNHSDLNKRIKIFSNSLVIHILVSLLLLIILEITGGFLFNGFLHIPTERMDVAELIYHVAVMMIIISILTAPFRAILIAKENILFISIVDILDGLWKVVIAIMISVSTLDRLTEYAFLNLGIYIFSFVCFVIYDFIKYSECKIPKISHLDISTLRKLSSFAGWSLYSGGCIIGRNQGIALILNIFVGTIANAAYGIASQVNGAVNYIGASLQTAFSPVITRTEGLGNREMMLYLSATLSKISLLLMSMIGIPIMVNISSILELWLSDVPHNTSLFCCVVIAAAIIDQTTAGLIVANRAIGKLKEYSLLVDTIKILSCFALLLLFIDVPLHISIWVYSIFELISALVELHVLKQNAGLNIRSWVINVIGKSIIPIIILSLTWIILFTSNFKLFTFCLQIIVISIFYIFIVYKVSLSKNEKDIVKSYTYCIWHKIKK